MKEKCIILIKELFEYNCSHNFSTECLLYLGIQENEGEKKRVLFLPYFRLLLDHYSDCQHEEIRTCPRKFTRLQFSPWNFNLEIEFSICWKIYCPPLTLLPGNPFSFWWKLIEFLKNHLMSTKKLAFLHNFNKEILFSLFCFKSFETKINYSFFDWKS